MRQIFKIFFEQEQTRPWLVLLCLFFGGFAEAIGIGTLLPLITSVLNTGSGEPSLIDRYIRIAFDYIGMAPSFGNIIMLLACIMIFRSVLLFTALSYAGIASARVANVLRRNLIRAVLEARWSYYANQSSGRLATALGNDAGRAGEAYMLFATTIACSVQICAYAAVAFLINWRVAIAGIAGGLLVALASGRLVKISRRASFKQADRISVMTADVMDILHNIKALKSMHRYQPSLSHLDVVLRRLKKSLYTTSLARYGLVYGNDIIVTLLVSVGAYVMYAFVGASVPQILVLGVLFFQVITYASKLQKQFQVASLLVGFYARTNELLTDARNDREVLSGTAAPSIGSGLVVKDVSFDHGGKPVLEKLSLDIPANAITVIQGASGAGKTTLLDLLIGFHRPKSGHITVGGTSLADIDLKQWRNMIGYVPQELALFHDTVSANISLFDETITPEAVRASADLAGVSAFLHLLPNGLETDVGEFGGKLSGGQRQRISLARALVHSPKLLILDEVTSALDPETESAIVTNIAELRGRYTIIAITHRPAWTHIADRLYTLNDGKAVLHLASKRKKTR
jgi:ATP-binding cassette, subfamily C, bacterial